MIDFGVAKVANTGVDQTRAGFIGTPAFASPEQFDGTGHTPVDTRSDIYSLGVTFWYLLSGRTPFTGRTFEEIRARQSEEPPLDQLTNAEVSVTGDWTIEVDAGRRSCRPAPIRARAARRRLSMLQGGAGRACQS